MAHYLKEAPIIDAMVDILGAALDGVSSHDERMEIASTATDLFKGFRELASQHLFTAEEVGALVKQLKQSHCYDSPAAVKVDSMLFAVSLAVNRQLQEQENDAKEIHAKETKAEEA